MVAKWEVNLDTAISSAGVPDSFWSSRRIALISFIAIVGLAGCGLAFTIFALDVQSAARAYVNGNGYWSKAHIQANYHLTRYSYSGDPRALQQAREALAIPLGDRRGRLALDKEPPDLEAAREGFLAGGNHPDDISGIIWMYRYFADDLFFADAVAIWREADQYILAMDKVADKLEAAFDNGQVNADKVRELRQELVALNQKLRPLDAAFAETLADGSRWLSEFLVTVSIIILILIVVGAALIFRWATRSIASSESKFRATFRHAAVGMAQLQLDEHFLDINESLCLILQRSRDELLQTDLNEITYPPDRLNDETNFRALMQGAVESYVVDKRLLRSDNTPVWCKLTLSRVGENMDLPRYLIVVIEDVSEAHRLSSELSYQATHDSLTGVINRVEFETRLQDAIRDALDKDNRHTLCFMDLDQFKIVNDTCGHVAGDALLCHVVEVLDQQLRRGDVLARLGGDEFGIIFIECDINSAQPVAEKLRKALSGFNFIWEGATFNITVSMGLVEINAATSDANTLLKSADTACYSAKDQGRNQVHAYSETDLVLAARRNEMEWVSRIRDAVNHDRLQLFAQEIQSLVQPDSKRYEVLVRLIDMDGRLIMPDMFLPAAERYNIATLVDRWVVKSALAAMQAHPEWLARIEALHINLSGQSISREEFLYHIEELLDHYAVPATKICFEITETAAISSLAEARRLMESLGRRGCQFALDDFGSGLSSFGYLRSLPVDMVKIDGCFVRHLNEDDVHLAMVRSISEVARIMNKLTVAEFVDSEATLAILRELGVNYGQGYAIHKPCSLDELITQIR